MLLFCNGATPTKRAQYSLRAAEKSASSADKRRTFMGERDRASELRLCAWIERAVADSTECESEGDGGRAVD